MTEEDRLRAEIARLEKDISRVIREIEASQWEIEVLAGAISDEQDPNLRGQLVQKQGRERDKSIVQKDIVAGLQGQLSDAEAQLRAEIAFQQSRPPDPPAPDDPPPPNDGDEPERSDWLERRRLRRERDRDIGGM